jgi:hypothetical protein
MQWRDIQMSPFVREELTLYRESLPHDPAPDSPVFPVRGGGHGDRHNLGRRLSHIVAIANELRSEAGHAPLPKRITPHTFRRTFITLCFQAGKDIVFVQSQAGHADWKTTLAIYTQVSHRSVDPEIRELLDIFLGMPETGEIAGPTAARVQQACFSRALIALSPGQSDDDRELGVQAIYSCPETTTSRSSSSG